MNLAHARKLGAAAAVAIALGGGSLVVGRNLGRAPAESAEVTLYGNVDVRQVELGFRVGGRLQAMRFEEGEMVSAGTVMAELDARAFEDERRAAEAGVAAEEATLQKLVAGSRPAELGRARAAIDEAAAEEQNARAALDRAEKLLAESAIPRASYDEALAAHRVAAAHLAAAAETYQLVVEGARKEDVAAARARLEVAQARLASAETALADTKLVAPSDGVVLSRIREPGAIVSPVDIVYVLSLNRSVWVRAYVSEKQLGAVRPGMQVQVFSDAFPSHPYRGHVGFVSPTAEFTPKTVETTELRTDLVYRLRVIVDDSDTGLLQGMPVTVRVDTGGV